MIDDESRDILERFLENGLDVSSFRFRDNVDKQHVFAMYDDYMQLFASKSDDIEVYLQTTDDDNVNVFISGKEICHVYFTSDMNTIKMDTFESLENPALIFCIKVLMGTIRELGEMVNQFSSLLSKLKTEVEEQDRQSELEKLINKSIKKNTNKKYQSVPTNVFNSIDKINKIQKNILKDIDKLNVTKKNDYDKDKK